MQLNIERVDRAEVQALIDRWLKAELDEDAYRREAPEGELFAGVVLKSEPPWKPDDYAPEGRPEGDSDETFHAKIVLADGLAAYVGSANLLRRSKGVNLECGMLVEGAAVRSIKVVVDAVISTFS